MVPFSRYVSGLAILAFSACSSGVSMSPGSAANTPALQSTTHRGTLSSSSMSTQQITTAPGYSVTLYARGTSSLTKPDAVVSAGGYTFVAYQNATTATGGGGNSTIVEYVGAGKIAKTLNLPGRIDGMRYNYYANAMWITVNEDANSSLYTWNPWHGTLNHYTFSSASHGGGYDDLAFANGKAFIAASNPTLNSSGVNTGPAVVSVTLSGTVAHVTPVLYGNSSARDVSSGSTVTLNLTDPDSLTVAPNGDVVLVSQGDSELVYLHNAGLPTQSVSRLAAGTQLDDTVYATESDGIFYVVDSSANATYIMRGPIQSGAIYTEAPSDSGVNSFIGIVNPTTGSITPVIIGFGSPTGLIFVTDRD